MLLEDRDLRARMASANRERIRIFEPKVVAAEYFDVLRSFVRGCSSEVKAPTQFHASSRG